MDFSELELHYIKQLLINHSLELLDIRMNYPDEKDSVSELAAINHSIMDKLKNFTQECENVFE